MSPQLNELLSQASQSFQKNHLDTAKSTLKLILEKVPEQLDAHLLLLKIALSNKDHSAVDKHADIIIKKDKNNIDALLAKLQLFEIKELYFDAITTLTQLLVQKPDNLNYQYKKGINATKAGLILEAEALLLNCYKNRFSDPYLTLNLGHIYKAKGNSSTAAKFYHEFITKNKNISAIGYWSLADLKDYKFKMSELKKMTQVLESAKLSHGNKSLTLFAMGRAYEQRKEYKESFQAMQQANDIIAKYKPFQGDLYAELINNFISKFLSPTKSTLTNNTFTPIFIVGMPRSGSTLIEQILASHSQVQSTDELPYMERIGLELEMNHGYVNSLIQITNDKIQTLVDQYTSQIKQYLTEFPPMVIDKNPNNFLHIGLIKTLFPQAKIINVIRDPLDNALSVYKQYFSNGHDYSYSLEGISFYWQGYVALMKHWDKLYPEQIFHISYESLVANSEAEIRNILEYCGLDFESECLTFYQSDRIVLTPSVSQVRQPINNRAINSWKKYQPFIKQHLPIFSQIKTQVEQLLP